MSRRTLRINELIRDELSDIIRRETRDPRLDPAVVSITDVETTQDLRHAKVYVSVLGTEEERRAVMDALTAGRAFYRRLLGQRLSDLHHITELHFKADISIERGQRLTDILNQLAREREEAVRQRGEAG